MNPSPSTLTPGARFILAKWVGRNLPRVPTPVEYVGPNSGEVVIVREIATGQEYPAGTWDLRPVRPGPAPAVKLTARQARILAL